MTAGKGIVHRFRDHLVSSAYVTVFVNIHHNAHGSEMFPLVHKDKGNPTQFFQVCVCFTLRGRRDDERDTDT